jgi:ATPase
MLTFRKKISSQKFKRKARRTLSSNFVKEKRNYVTDTSAIINKFDSTLIKKGISGRIIIPNAVMAELENLANKGREEGFLGLEEIAGFHKLKHKFPVQIYFEGTRPSEMQIRYAKGGEIDALIRDIARNNKAILITADLVQAKTAQAYNLQVLFLKPKQKIEKKRFWFWRK